MYHRRQGYYGRLHQAVRSRIESTVRERLAKA